MNWSEDIPTDYGDLDATTALDLFDVEVGETLWIAASPIRDNKFRALKVTVEERASVNGYEEFNAIETWDDGPNTTIHGPAQAHQDAEGYSDE